MAKTKHQWATFHKGRVKLKACASCGELHLPSNSDKDCEHGNLFDSQLVKAGYKMHQDTAA